MEDKKLKLNTKRTILIGFSFFTILMLWQVYNFYCPLILNELFNSVFGEGNYSYIVGVVMALDNILALFMIPLFGNLSDKTHTRLGKRMPYIIAGTLVAIALFPFISLMFVWNSLVGVAIMMALILIAMNIYRGPSVALMPDVTPKPLRAKANAIINFVGYLGAILGTVLTMIFNKVDETEHLVRTFTIWPFVITSVFMLVALIVLVLKVRENKILEETRAEMEIGEQMSETNEAIVEDKPLSKADRRNLWLLIISVFLWYFSFNAIETFGSTYAQQILHTTKWGLVTTVLAASSLLTFLPSTKLIAKVGRKWSIIIGLLLMIAPMIACIWVTNIYAIAVLFAVAGAGWAMINVSSYPMMVELASSKNIGKFTGYYYSASQVAQSITPIAIGFVLTWIGYKAFFPYALLFMALALLVFAFIKVVKKKDNADSVTIEVPEKITFADESGENNVTTAIVDEKNAENKDLAVNEEKVEKTNKSKTTSKKKSTTNKKPTTTKKTTTKKVNSKSTKTTNSTKSQPKKTTSTKSKSTSKSKK